MLKIGWLMTLGVMTFCVVAPVRRLTPDEVIGLGDDVVVLGRYTARAKATGAPLDVPFAHVWRFRDGRAVRFHQFTDTRGWVDALSHPAEEDG